MKEKLLIEQLIAANKAVVAEKINFIFSVYDSETKEVFFMPIMQENAKLNSNNYIKVSINGLILAGDKDYLPYDYSLHLDFYKSYPSIQSVCHAVSENFMIFSKEKKSLSYINNTSFDYQKGSLSVYDKFPKKTSSINSEYGALALKNQGCFIWNKSTLLTFVFAKSLETKIFDSFTEIITKKQYLDYDKDGILQARQKGLFVTVKELALINYGLLKFFDHFCRTHDIKYSIAGGTLLGAVRHGGFIPWDDDIDVFMSRPEYEKLISCFTDTDRYEIINSKKDKNYFLPYARLIDKRTLIKNSPITTEVGKGIFLDICIIDGLPKSVIRRNNHIYHMRFLFKARIASHYPKRMKYGKPLMRFAKHLIYYFTNIRFWNRRLECSMSRYAWNTSDYVGNFTSQYGKNELMHKSSFDSYVDIQFEDDTFMACVGWREYLTNIYGDYLNLPPSKKRKGHHPAEIYWV